MRLRWIGISAAAIGALTGLVAWGCHQNARAPQEETAAGPDYTNFAPPPLQMPAPAANAPGPDTSEDTECLAKAAALLRMLAADDVEYALDTFQARPQFEFLTASESYRASPDAWACFFATTITILGNRCGPETTVAYYNPFLDAAVLTRWRTGPDGEPQVAGASLRSGLELARGSLAAEQEIPRWMTAEESAPQALRHQYRAFVDAFSMQFPPQGQTPWAAYARTSGATLEVVGGLNVVQMRSLDVLQNGDSGPVRGLLREFHTALAAGDTAGLGRLLPRDNPMSAETLASLPVQFRVHLCPVHMLWDEQRAMVFVGDSRTLRFYGIAQYETKPTVQLKSFTLFDLAADDPVAVAAGEGAKQ